MIINILCGLLIGLAMFIIGFIIGGRMAIKITIEKLSDEYDLVSRKESDE